MIAEQIDCIVRFHDPQKMYELNRCIFSLVGQTYRPLRIVLAVQRFSEAEVAAIRAALAPLFDLPNAPALVIENWVEDDPLDARADLLNMGLAAATGQYVAFLDYDDVLYPEAYGLLIDRLKASGCGIAFASVRVVSVDVFPEFVHVAAKKDELILGKHLLDLFYTNFCPIHSYAIDRSIVDNKKLSFDSSMNWEEDYDFLLNICSSYRSDFSALDKTIGDYYCKNDGSNSIPTDGLMNEERTMEYGRVQAYIETKKIITRISPEVQRQLGVARVSPELTIRGALQELRRPEA